MVVLLEGSPISREELWSSVSDNWVLGYLPVQVPSPPIAQFGRADGFKKSLCGQISSVFRMMEATVFLGTFNAAYIFLVPFPRSILSQSSVDNSFDLMAWFML